MTKAISDVDDCAEGMRKFTTEIFDTGVALVGYAVMLLCLRLAAGAAVHDLPAGFLYRDRGVDEDSPCSARARHIKRPLAR